MQYLHNIFNMFFFYYDQQVQVNIVLKNELNQHCCSQENRCCCHINNLSKNVNALNCMVNLLVTYP